MATTDVWVKGIGEKSELRPSFYHGGENAVRKIDASRTSDDGEHLCASASVNVARRYGDVISEFKVNEGFDVAHMSRSDWMHNAGPTMDEMRTAGYGVVIVDPDGSFDFPRKMLVVLNPDSVSFVREVPVAVLGVLDDGLAFKEPRGPGERGWAKYVESVYGEDEIVALNDCGVITPKPEPLPDGVVLAKPNSPHFGNVTAVTKDFVSQSAGQGKLVAHPRADFETAPDLDKPLDVAYRDGKASTLVPKVKSPRMGF